MGAMGIIQPQFGTDFFGRINFSAATEGELTFDDGGSWRVPAIGSGASPFYSAMYNVLARQKDVFEITTVTDDTEYFFTYDGVKYSFTSGTSTTALLIRAGLIAAVAAKSPGNGLTAALVDGTHFYVQGISGGEYHKLGAVSSGDGLLTPAAGIDTIPANTLYQKQGSVLVRFASAFTGYVDVRLCHK